MMLAAASIGCDSEPPPEENETIAEEALGFWGHGPHRRNGALAGDTLMFHGNRTRHGWVNAETTLTPQNVRGGAFGRRWESPQFAATPDGLAPHIYGSVLYAGRVRIDAGSFHGLFDVAFAATNNNDVYAVNVAQRGAVAPGTILWRAQVAPPMTQTQLGEGVAYLGIMSTPVIDRSTFDKPRIYVGACVNDGLEGEWRMFALDLANGATLPGWPVAINNTILNSGGLNKNGGDGATRFEIVQSASQRGALITSNDGRKLYVPFGGYFDAAAGWLVTIDTASPAITSAFATGRSQGGANGGIWAAGGTVVDRDGNLFTPTGNGPVGLVGVPFNWGESVLRLDTATDELTGTYTPQNLLDMEVHDVDLASNGLAVDLSPRVTDVPKVIAVAGKHGSIYLLNRASLPGTLVNRTDTTAFERSLLPPVGGVVNVFPPDSPVRSNVDYAHMRNSPAYFNDGHRAYMFAAGTSKEPCSSTAVFGCDVADGNSSLHSVAPSIARVRIHPSGGVQKDGTGANIPGRWPYLRVEQTNEHLVFLSPGSPEVSSNGDENVIVWELAANVKRRDRMVDLNTPRTLLYATDFNLRLLWNSANSWNVEVGRTTDLPVLGVGGKYGGSPTIAQALVIVGTDRITAFGLSQATTLKPAADAHVVDGASAATNFGNAPRMLIQTGGAAGTNRNAYLRFNLRHLHKVGRAVLRVCANVEADSTTPDANADLQQQIGLDVFAANDSPAWNEATITWNNQPGFAATPLKPLPVNLHGTSIIWYEFDITEYVRARRAAGRDVNLALRAQSHATSIVVNSGENFENSPQLVISPN